MKTVTEFTEDMVAQLRAADPSASCEVGTPERKIIEAVAAILAQSQVNFEALSVQHDIDRMSAGQLDAFLGTIFRFGRQSATAAQGRVRFQRTTAATQPVIIPRGTQVVASIEDSSLPTVPFMTTELGVIPVGESYVDIPVQAQVLGSVGNVDVNTITSFSGLRSINGVTSLTNLEPTRGGIDAENDDDYKTRFKNTFFRNIAGTHDQYLALAVSQTGISKANVVGPVSRYVEHIQIPDDNDVAQKTQTGGYDDSGDSWRSKRTTEVSTIPYSKYTFPDNSYLTDTTLDPSTAKFFRHYVDYVFNNVPIDATGPGSTQQDDTVNELLFKPNITILGRQSIDYNTWTASTSYDAGNLVVPTTGNGRIYRCTVAGTSAGSEPTWPVINGGTVVDGGVTWQDITWDDSTAYVIGDVVYGSTAANRRRTFVCIDSGTSGVAEPTWSTVDGDTVTDNDITWQDSTLLPLGLEADTIVLLEHQYMSSSSRCIPGEMENCVDIFVNGENPRYVSSAEIVPPSTQVFQSGDDTIWTYADSTKYRRMIDHEDVGLGNLAMPVYWQPMIDVPNSITIENNTYYKANYFNPDDSTYYNEYNPTTEVYSVTAHYIAYEELGANYGTVRARNGIEWFLSGNNWVDGIVETGTPKKIDEFLTTQFTLRDYVFDQNIPDLQNLVERNKQVTTDPLVHKAMNRYFRINVTVQYNQGANQALTDVLIKQSVRTFFNSQYFGAAIQLSDILAVVHAVPGVDNVRWTNDVDAGVPKVEEVRRLGDVVLDTFNFDFYLQDDELPYSPDIESEVAHIVRRAGNTWNS